MSRRLRISPLALLAVLSALLLSVPAPTPAAPAPPPRKPTVEVVFCLDTTGSMSGLIEGAKLKIWSICNQILNGMVAGVKGMSLKPGEDFQVVTVSFDAREIPEQDGDHPCNGTRITTS